MGLSLQGEPPWEPSQPPRPDGVRGCRVGGNSPRTTAAGQMSVQLGIDVSRCVQMSVQLQGSGEVGGDVSAKVRHGPVRLLAALWQNNLHPASRQMT